ncbi:Do family serine endopeptidase [Hansschlegelia beijingensis]|uniref:Probable periplasmic serine endoprotease DegP-like n=1 Tax=Hansschlegelia beijingensis TaxID=1133344 RepID=A0A7W6GFS7_9HYPH|nr:Do family serine endopeptidase [Hansschlegelia beijingensis]MBB3971959.1 serine protease Do [Hansschlegelia beijingensis]
MTIEPRRPSDTGSGFLARRRRTVIASALALGVAGALGGQALTSYVAPAHADTASAIQPQAGPALPSFAEVVDRVKPAVVSVRVKNIATDDEASAGGMPGVPGLDQLPNDHPLKKFFREFGQGQGGKPRQHRGMAQGSGFFISSDGYVVTNNHVVQGAKEVELKPDDDTTYKAKVVGTDPRTDLALLKVEGDKKDFPYVKFAKDGPRVGDWVIAVGNPFGLGGSVTAGIVSARGRDIGAGPYDDFLQIDAAVNRGNSGGPTFNLRGEVVGVNTAIYSPSGGNVGIAFSIPSEVATGIVEKLKTGGTIARGYIGVQIQPVTDEIAESLGLKKAQGALVAEAQKGTPGEKAGLKSGDTILKVDGEEIGSARDLSRKIASMDPGKEVTLTIWRDGKEETKTLKLGTLPEEPKQAALDQSDDDASGSKVKLGIEVTPASKMAGAGDQGLVVTNVDEDGAAAGKLEAGDVILRVGGKDVSSVSDVTSQLDAAQKEGKKSVLLLIKRSDATRFVAIEIGKS